jgi:hypothetical protein
MKQKANEWRRGNEESPKMEEDGSISFTCDGPSSAFFLFARARE